MDMILPHSPTFALTALGVSTIDTAAVAIDSSCTRRGPGVDASAGLGVAGGEHVSGQNLLLHHGEIGEPGIEGSHAVTVVSATRAPSAIAWNFHLKRAASIHTTTFCCVPWVGEIHGS